MSGWFKQIHSVQSRTFYILLSDESSYFQIKKRKLMPGQELNRDLWDWNLTLYHWATSDSWEKVLKIFDCLFINAVIHQCVYTVLQWVWVWVYGGDTGKGVCVQLCGGGVCGWAGVWSQNQDVLKWVHLVYTECKMVCFSRTRGVSVGGCGAC